MNTAALVIVETRDGAATAVALELLGLASALADTVVALLFGHPTAAPSLIAHGADCVYVCPVQSEEYESEVWLPHAAALARELEPAVVLAAHTPAGADLGPRLAFRLGSGIAAGCVELGMFEDRIVCTRPCHGGNVRETLGFTRGRAVATVRAGVGTARRDDRRTGDVIALQPMRLQLRVRVISRKRESAAGKRLEDAKIVVAGGRGLEGPEGFTVLEGLATVLDAAVGSSRVPCDLGWVPHSWQIGLTGKTVTPDLYVAVGISGAGHHMAGCGNAKTIVAINTDRDAAIFRDARFGAVGDYRRIVPALANAIAQIKAQD